MRTKLLLALFFVISFYPMLNAQNDIQIGRSPSTMINPGGGVYDYSDPSGVNIKVQVWGYVRLPGYYIVPSGLSIHEIISFAGGPTEDAMLDEIRIAKVKEGVQTVMKKYNYNDLMWEDKIRNQIEYVRLEAGDIVVIPGEPRYFLREDISFYLSLITALASLWALVFTITNN